jgi:hypothetical protein
MATRTWKSGRTGDFNTAGNWQGGLAPVAYDIAIIGTGKATLAQDETLLENLDIRLGAQISPLSSIFSGASSTSNLAITNDTIDQTETIGVIAAGGQISDLSFSNPAILGGMGVTGTVDFAGTINVAAGDALTIGIASPTATPGLFDNTGTINVTGTLGNYALVITHQGNQGSTGPGAADYGTVNLSYGLFIAEAPDAISPAATGQFTLKNDSALAIVNTIFTDTNVNFADATDTLLLGEDIAHQYWFGSATNGRIQNFQVGDTIALLASTTSAADPASWSYSATNGALSLFDASNTPIGTLYLAGNYAAANFSISPAIPSPISGYGNGYEITLDPTLNPNFWVSGATGDIDTAANWLGGAVPAPGADATLQAGAIDIASGDYVPSNLTLHVGTTVADVGAPSVSNIFFEGASLPSDLTIDNTGVGDTISGASYKGPALESALIAYGDAASSATVNVGAGDVEVFDVYSPNSSAAFFDNEGVINLNGAPGNAAVAYFSPTFSNSAANSAFYGVINLSYGFLFADVASALPTETTPGTAYASLSNYSDVYAVVPLPSLNVRFVDGSGNRLDLAPQSSGDAYQFGGAIANFQTGDTIALQETVHSPTPTGVTYSGGVLTIWDNSIVLGTLQISGNFGALTGAQESSSALSAFGYSGEYDITASVAPYTWLGGTADFTTPNAWSGGTVPPDGASAATPTIATIGAGTVQIGAADTAPADITFNVGALTLNAQTNSQPASVLSVTDNSLGQGVTLDNSSTGGDFPPNGAANLFLSALDIYGTVNFAGTINVGAGDGEFIKITPDSTTTTDPGFFNNTGTINLEGTAGNQAAMIVSQGGPSAIYQAGGFANYGTVNLSYGLFFAESPDSIPNPPRNGGGDFTLTNDSRLDIINTIFNKTTVTFGDGTDTLLLGEDGSNQYWFGGGANGVVGGLQAGDTIALAENGTSAIPASLKYTYVGNGSGVVIAQASARSGFPASVRRMAWSAPMARRRAVSTTDRMSA